MSRIIKKIAIFLLFVVVIGCGKDHSRQNNSDLIKSKQLNSESNNQNDEKINKITYYEPSEIVDDLLKTPGRGLNIAIVAPMSGKYADIGDIVVESAILAASRSKYGNASSINVYNIEKLMDKNWQENKEVQKLIKDDNDVIIGSFFVDTTKKLLSVLPKDKLFISFINNEELAREYPNLVVSSIGDGYKINSLLQYLQDTSRLFLSLVLPATKKGYAVEKLFRKFAPYYNVTIVGSQFYQSGSNVSMLASAKGINKTYKMTYMFDKNGNIKTETYKDRKIKKQNNDNNQDDVIIKTVKTNAVYIEADEEDLTTILSRLEGFGILDQNVQIFSNTVFNAPDSTVLRFNNLYYIGYNYSIINHFNNKFRHYFKHNPNYIAYMTYDILTMLYYIANEEMMLPRKLYDEDGFRGILDEFRFTREGSTERRFGIYEIRNGSMSRVFIPADYLPFDVIKNKSYGYFERSKNITDKQKKDNKADV